MFGCVTPNLSILLRNTSKAVLIELSISVCIIGLTSAFVLLKLIPFSDKFFVPKIVGSLNFIVPLLKFSNSEKNKFRYVSELFFCAASAATKA